MRTLVIAGTEHEANYWIIQDLGKKYPRNTSLSMSDYIIVHNQDQLRGMLVNPKGVFVGTWRERKDIFEILNTLLVRMTEPSKHKIIQDLLVEHILEQKK